jgi:hypothetical protein
MQILHGAKICPCSRKAPTLVTACYRAHCQRPSKRREIIKPRVRDSVVRHLRQRHFCVEPELEADLIANRFWERSNPKTS